MILTVAAICVVAYTGTTTALAKTEKPVDKIFFKYSTPTQIKTKSNIFYTHDFITATRIVGKYYGWRIKNWLVNCSSSEGGHGNFVWLDDYTYPLYGYSNTPGGWMQFMGSTFYSNLNWTVNDAKRRGLYISKKALNYYEPLGQALVAGAMYYRDGNTSWTGLLC